MCHSIHLLSFYRLYVSTCISHSCCSPVSLKIFHLLMLLIVQIITCFSDANILHFAKYFNRCDLGVTFFTPYQEGKYPQAVIQYGKIVSWLEMEYGLSEWESKASESLLLAAFLNLAMCYLKLRDYAKAIEYCNKVNGYIQALGGLLVVLFCPDLFPFSLFLVVRVVLPIREIPYQFSSERVLIIINCLEPRGKEGDIHILKINKCDRFRNKYLKCLHLGIRTTLHSYPR